MPDPASIRRLYGRRQGHALRPGQQRLLDELLPRVSVPAAGPLGAGALFGDDRPLALEIGFGAGEHLAAQAEAAPDTGFIGCEPFLNGVVGALAQIDRRGLANVRLYMGDALDVLERLPDASLARVFLLHPDPWPKARHAKRRFVNPGPLELLAAKLMPGAELRIGTDHPVYLRWTLMQMAAHPAFRWRAATPADWQHRPADWPETRYGAKARRLGHELWYLRYEYRPG
ncbi:MAG: tRNA (guanosine(46)-N7)-methyltransferase TrmB [Sphingomonadaceae bacterium]|nr:tRNA (guanosine(46)-N7)-methyltransferase TrmB [Sphingomonadaceae bacterium]